MENIHMCVRVFKRVMTNAKPPAERVTYWKCLYIKSKILQQLNQINIW